MAKIHNVLLPAELNEMLVRELEHVPEAVLSHIGNRFLVGGFTRTHAIRERLAAILRSPAPVESWLVILLAPGLAGRTTVAALTLEGLQCVSDSFAALGYREVLILALLFDPREEMQKFGAALLAQTPAEAPPADKKAATLALCQWVDARFLNSADISCVPSAAAEGQGTNADRPVDSAELQRTARLLKDITAIAEKQKKSIEHLKRNLQDQGRKQKTKLEAAARQAAEEKRNLVTERDQSRGKLSRLTREKDALAARLEQLSAEQQSTVDQGVAQQTSTLVRKWLAEPLATEQRLDELNAKSDDLLARVDQALDAQSRQDRLSGNRIELEWKLGRLRQARKQLTRAAQTALCPVPQVKEALKEVEEEVARTEKVLTGQRPFDPLTSKLLIAINQASNWDEARHLSALVERLADSDLVIKEDRRRLYDAIARKFSLLEERSRWRDTEAPDHGWSLRDAVYRNRPGLLILDGHNVLFGLDDIFGPHFEPNGRPGRVARERLVGMVRRLVEGRPNLHARICFDAPTHELITVSSNVEIEFSGGEGAHRADHRINEHLSWRRPEELEQKWFVVSDDRAVRRQALKHGAQYVPADLFAVLLADFRCLAETGCAEKAA